MPTHSPPKSKKAETKGVPLNSATTLADMIDVLADLPCLASGTHVRLVATDILARLVKWISGPRFFDAVLSVRNTWVDAC